MNRYNKKIIISIGMMLFMHSTFTASKISHSAIESGQLFAQQSKADLYWKAFMLAANKQKKAALELVQKIKLEDQVSVSEIKQDSIDELFDYFFISGAAQDPQLLSYLGLFESIGIREHNAHLNNVSPAHWAMQFQLLEKNLALLKEYSVETLTPEQQLSYKIFAWKFEHEISGKEFLYHEYHVNQMFGILVNLSMTLLEYHRLELAEDCPHYLARLNKIPQHFEQTIELLNHQKNLGIVSPSFALEKVILMIDRFLPAAIEDNIFYQHLLKKAAGIENVNCTQLALQVKDILEHKVYPAYRTLQNFCKHLLQQASANGVWALPNGDAYYVHALKRHTTVNMTPQEIHELGIKEVAHIQKQMRDIFAQEGLHDPAKSIGQLVEELGKDERFYFPQTEEGRQQCLAHFEAIVERARKELYPLFDVKPEAKLKIQPVPKHEEAGQPGAYYSSASMDGSRPGIFFANLRNMKEIPTYHMETLTIHEAEPGHHFQIAIQQEMDVPFLRKLGDYNVFYEGWALYTEKLAYEQGFYSSSFAKIGHLQDELLRAARLVVDTGIHYKRWPYQQAIDYMVQATGMARSSATTEVERYFVYPGQACSYKIGQLKLLELRKKMKEALGNHYDIRAFHNIVLKLGAAPLEILEEVIDKYIKEKLSH